jgi:hypothetical protein
MMYSVLKAINLIILNHVKFLIEHYERLPAVH